jgi:NAD(P)-dependent dehydrogenase (short-subunit alcohol dehydrogenase family)
MPQVRVRVFFRRSSTDANHAAPCARNSKQLPCPAVASCIRSRPCILHQGQDIEAPFTVGVILLDDGPAIRSVLTNRTGEGLKAGDRMWATMHAVPAMIQKNYGKLVTVICDAGRVGEPNLEIYSGAKAGAAGFMRAMAKALGRYSITSNCVALGATRTPAIAAATSNEEFAKRMLKSYTIRRFGEPEDAANMILFLASDASSWMTGQTVPVNGGYSFAM